MFNKNKQFKFATLILFIIFIIGILGYYILWNAGMIPIKYASNSKEYEFTEDMNNDGKDEKIKFVNKYNSYEYTNRTDSMYTINNIEIYMDDTLMYSDKIETMQALVEPEIIEFINTKKIYIHTGNGGPVLPLDYYFYIKDNKMVFDVEDGRDILNVNDYVKN